MSFAFETVASDDAWRDWRGTNFQVGGGCARIAAAAAPGYRAPTPLVEDPPAEFRPVDFDLDRCGHLWVLTASGAVYRVRPDGDGLRRVPCALERRGVGVATAICATRDGVYVAEVANADGWDALPDLPRFPDSAARDGSGDPDEASAPLRGRVHALSRRLQTRWVADGFAVPVALDADGETVAVLDRGGDGAGSLVGLDGRGAVRREVTGVPDPVDLSVGPDGDRYALERRSGGPTVERFPRPAGDAAGDRCPDGRDADGPAGADDAEADEAEDPVSVVVPPEAFPVDGAGDPVEPASLAASAAGRLLVGLEPDAGIEPSLLRYRPERGSVERLPVQVRGCLALACERRGPDGDVSGLFALDAERVLSALDAERRRRRNPETDRYDAELVQRFDSGEHDTRWHRVTMAIADLDPGTQVRLRYLATNDDRLRYATPAEQDIDLEVVDGIGPTYAGRLRAADVTGLSELVELTPERLAAVASADVIGVSTSRVETWIERAEALLAATDPGESPPSLRDVRGIGPTYAGRLRDAGVTDLSTLVGLSPGRIAAVVSTEVATVSTDTAASWIADARDRLSAVQPTGDLDWVAMSEPNPRDALLDDAVGRYLWVKLELVGNERATPRVGSFRAYFPRQSYLRYLPAIYREDPAGAAFLERYLSVFESVFTDVEEALEHVTRYLDPESVPAEYIAWLGRWLALGVDERWSEPAKREFVARAPWLFKQRGTRRGLRAVLATYLRYEDVGADWRPAHEHARERLESLIETGYLTAPEAERGRATHDALAGAGDEPLVYVFEYSLLGCVDADPVRERYEALVPCPQCVLVLVGPGLDDEQLAAVEDAVSAWTPAHAVVNAVGLRARTRLGGTSFLGVDTALADPALRLDESGLGADSVLESRGDAGELDVQARLGTDSTLS